MARQRVSLFVGWAGLSLILGLAGIPAWVFGEEPALRLQGVPRHEGQLARTLSDPALQTAGSISLTPRAPFAPASHALPRVHPQLPVSEPELEKGLFVHLAPVRVRLTPATEGSPEARGTTESREAGRGPSASALGIPRLPRSQPLQPSASALGIPRLPRSQPLQTHLEEAIQAQRRAMKSAHATPLLQPVILVPPRARFARLRRQLPYSLAHDPVTSYLTDLN